MFIKIQNTLVNTNNVWFIFQYKDKPQLSVVYSDNTEQCFTFESLDKRNSYFDLLQAKLGIN